MATTSSCSARSRRLSGPRSPAMTVLAPYGRSKMQPGCYPTSTLPPTAVVIGAEFIGLEMAENLVMQGIEVTIVEATPQVLPPLDPELAILVQDELGVDGVQAETSATVGSVDDTTCSGANWGATR